MWRGKHFLVKFTARHTVWRSLCGAQFSVCCDCEHAKMANWAIFNWKFLPTCTRLHWFLGWLAGWPNGRCEICARRWIDKRHRDTFDCHFRCCFYTFGHNSTRHTNKSNWIFVHFYGIFVSARFGTHQRSFVCSFDTNGVCALFMLTANEKLFFFLLFSSLSIIYTEIDADSVCVCFNQNNERIYFNLNLLFKFTGTSMTATCKTIRQFANMCIWNECTAAAAPAAPKRTCTFTILCRGIYRYIVL